MSGYSSKDCSVKCTNYRYKGSCLEKCPDSTYVFENIKYCVGCPSVIIIYINLRIVWHVKIIINVHHVKQVMYWEEVFVIIIN